MNLNEYFSNYKFFKNKIIVISAKDEASKYFNLFTEKRKYSLIKEIKYRNSYIAVIDIKRQFYYEHTSNDMYECSYKVKDKFIDIISAGYDKGNKSSIKIDDTEYSCNRRGLNVAVFNYRTLTLIDKFYCDTYSDQFLTIRR